ncbi:MAG TPA: M56 family metallopeptidase [Terriglobales bacterium]|nr:M56 family metallopeptidase [Terriglobales bacterium]
MTHVETNLAANLLRVLLSASVRAVILSGLSFALLKIVRVRAAAVRKAVWTAVLLAMLLMPLLRTALPPFRVPLLPFSSARSTVVPSAPSASRWVGKITGAGETSDAQFVQPKTQSITSLWPLLTLVVYAAGGLLLLVRQAIGHFLAGKLVRSSPLLEAADLVALKPRLPLGATIPDLRRSSLVRVPVVVGVLNPAIILPADWSAWKEEQLAAVLAHEISHVQRCDPLVRFLSSLNKSLYWFHPLAWWLDRHLSELAEQVSDDAALVAVADRQKYAEVLLGFAAAASKGAGRVRWSGLAMASTSHLGARIERILTSRAAAPDRWARRRLVFLLIAAPLAVVSSAAIELTRVRPMQSSKSDSVTGGVGPQSFAGTWQGVWHDTWMGSQSSLFVTLNLKQADGRLSGATSSTVQKQAAQKQKAIPLPEATPPHLTPPPPPAPPPPPTGAMLDVRIEGRTLIFKVKAPDAKVVDFRLTLQASDTGTLKVTSPRPSQFYPDFEMKRMR